MSVRWITAFIDLPADRLDDGRSFWSAVTDTTVSPARGRHGEFATLLPETGDAHVRIQRVQTGHGGIHLDLHVDAGAVSAEAARAVASGATVIDPHNGDNLVTLASPGGLPFCLVAHHGESTSPKPVPTPAPNRLNQVCIDVPSAAFDAELAFWSDLTGWAPEPGRLSEFVFLTRPSAQPIRLLLQRLGDENGQVDAHLDVGCGDAVAAVAVRHEGLGATVVQRFRYWTVMTDPAGLTYCLTSRDPNATSAGG